MHEAIARSIIRFFHYNNSEALYLLADAAYARLARHLQLQQPSVRVIPIPTCAGSPLPDLPPGAQALLLAEPETYVGCRLYEQLDFSRGEPQLPGAASRVLVFPQESLYRMFSAGMDESCREKERLLSIMQPRRRYRITTALGTDLVFEAREWLPLDFEVCTAPVEGSVNGTIVADGALFFGRIDEPLSFGIRSGMLESITTATPGGESLAARYRSMTARDMAQAANRQLAEIGIGFCRGAAISDCFMEAEAAADTCHFCFGNNLCYGGRNESSFHGASILVRQPVFTPIG